MRPPRAAQCPAGSRVSRSSPRRSARLPSTRDVWRSAGRLGDPRIRRATTTFRRQIDTPSMAAGDVDERECAWALGVRAVRPAAAFASGRASVSNFRKPVTETTSISFQTHRLPLARSRSNHGDGEGADNEQQGDPGGNFVKARQQHFPANENQHCGKPVVQVAKAFHDSFQSKKHRAESKNGKNI